MWNHSIEEISERVQKYRIFQQDSRISFFEVIEHWQNSFKFRELFMDLLSSARFSAFRWETPPLTSKDDKREFEFVLVRSDMLARDVDQDAFAEQFRQAGGASVISFPNLGNDAIMVVPCPENRESQFGHLGRFTRNARAKQNHELWQMVGEQMQKRLSDKPVWLSTAGMGVSWLHIRLDDRPKYYHYDPYRLI